VIVKCDSCHEYKNSVEFIEKGIKHKFCRCCRQMKTCIVCGKEKLVLAFFYEGEEHERCICRKL